MGPREGLDTLATGSFVGRGRIYSQQFISTVPYEIAHVMFQRRFIDWYIALCGGMLNKS